MRWMDQQLPHHLGAYQNGPISSPTPYLLNKNLHFSKIPQRSCLRNTDTGNEAEWRDCLEAELLPKASWRSWVLENLLSVAPECWEGKTGGILKAHVKCFTHVNAAWHIHPAYPLLSILPWDVSSQEMALVIRCELTHSKKLAWATKTLLPSLSDCTLEVSWGFCKGPQNDLAIPGLSLPYSCDLSVGEIGI